MHEYRIHTLVDITYNGNLKRQFPFTTDAGHDIKDKHTLAMARNQNSNFSTMVQLLQMRGNITWEHPPQKMELPDLGNHAFGSYYEGQNMTWHFQFFTEQSGVYGDLVNPHRQPSGGLQPNTHRGRLHEHSTPTYTHLRYERDARNGKAKDNRCAGRWDHKHILFILRPNR